MKLSALAVVLMLCGILSAESNIVFTTDFEPASPTSSGPGSIVSHEGSNRLFIERTDRGSTTRHFAIDAAAIRGRVITISADVTAENVAEPPNSWNGIKVMLVLRTSVGSDYPQIPIPTGTFTCIRRSHTLRVPSAVTGATLVLGLEETSGRVWFDNVSIAIAPPRNIRRFETRFTGHDLPRLRGFMYGPQFREDDIRDLALEYNANQIRWQLNWTPMKAAEDWAADLDAFDKWLDGALTECDKALDACEKYNIRVLVDLHTPPGGRVDGGVCRLFQQKKYQGKLLQVWGRIAARYKGRQVIYAYDLLNEPVEGAIAAGLDNWTTLATRAAKAIRAVDPEKPIVFEPSPWGSAAGFDTLVPLEVDRVIYSFHMYQPHQFTHQGVSGNREPVTYPGVINARFWDKDALRDNMASVIEFQRAANVQIYVGEFSVIRWAPGDSGLKWLTDVTDIFEQQKWDWSYHAFREWDGWSLEHGPDKDNRRPTDQPTDRAKLIRSLLARNKR